LIEVPAMSAGLTAQQARLRSSGLARPVERDVERVLLDRADDFPMLAMLVEPR
jgi:hypothetical protein